MGACEPGELQACMPAITQAVLRPAIFVEGGAISLELLVLWFYVSQLRAQRGRDCSAEARSAQ